MHHLHEGPAEGGEDTYLYNASSNTEWIDNYNTTARIFNANRDTEWIDKYNATAEILNNNDDIVEDQESKDAGEITVTGNIDCNTMLNLDLEPSVNQNNSDVRADAIAAVTNMATDRNNFAYDMRSNDTGCEWVPVKIGIFEMKVRFDLFSAFLAPKLCGIVGCKSPIVPHKNLSVKTTSTLSDPSGSSMQLQRLSSTM